LENISFLCTGFLRNRSTGPSFKT